MAQVPPRGWLPQAGRSLGQGMREFKDSLTGSSAAAADEPKVVERASST